MFLVFVARGGFFFQIYPWPLPGMALPRACPVLEWSSSGELSNKTEAINVRTTSEHLLCVRGSMSDQRLTAQSFEGDSCILRYLQCHVLSARKRTRRDPIIC